MSTTADLFHRAEARRAIKTSETVWRVHGEEPVVLTGEELTKLGPSVSEYLTGVVTLSRIRRFECHLLDLDNIAPFVGLVSQLSRANWDVWVVLPLKHLGLAHDELHGLPVRLQGWWLDDNDNIKFTIDETA